MKWFLVWGLSIVTFFLMDIILGHTNISSLLGDIKRYPLEILLFSLTINAIFTSLSLGSSFLIKKMMMQLQINCNDWICFFITIVFLICIQIIYSRLADYYIGGV